MDLRQRVLQGGTYLVLRQLIGLFVGLAGSVAVTRLIGPSNYGAYAGALALVFFCGRLGRLGLDVYLVRRREEPEPVMYNQALTILLISGSLFALGLFLLTLIPGFALINDDFERPLRVLLPTLPLSLFPIPAVVGLERNLDYRKVSFIDLAGQLAYVPTAVAMAFWGQGVWAPITGYWMWQLVVAALSWRLFPTPPRLVRSTAGIGEMLRYGASYSASTWIWQLRFLVNPLIVGHSLGTAGVGYVSLSVQFVEMLAFVKNATYRLSFAALAKIQEDHRRLRAALEEAMVLQVLAVAPPLIAFALIAPWLLPLLYGSRWNSVLEIYPFIALSYLINTTFNMHTSVLYVLNRNRDVGIFNACNVIVFGAACAILIPHVGLVGYGLAEIVALSSYFILDVQTRKLFSVSYDRVFPWLVGFVPALFTGLLPTPWQPVLLVPLVLISLFPQQRQQIHDYFKIFRNGLSRSTTKILNERTSHS